MLNNPLFFQEIRRSVDPDTPGQYSRAGTCARFPSHLLLRVAGVGREMWDWMPKVHDLCYAGFGLPSCSRGQTGQKANKIHPKTNREYP